MRLEFLLTAALLQPLPNICRYLETIVVILGMYGNWVYFQVADSFYHELQ